MKPMLGLTATCALMLTAHLGQPAAQTSSNPVAQLSEQDKAVVIKAAIDAKSHQKTPKEFTPTVGATVPKSLFIHGFKPEIAGKVTSLKHFWYAFLDHEVVLIDATQKKVVAVIPLPAQPASAGQGHHGAAEAASEPKPQDGSKSTDSVPAYTSPETIK